MGKEKKVVAAVEEEAPKKRGRPKGSKNKAKEEAAPDSEKVVKKTRVVAKEEAPKKEPAKKGGRPKGSKNKVAKETKPRVVFVPFNKMSSKAKELVSEVDNLEIQLADYKDMIAEKLQELIEELGGCSFEHPDRGAMTIMQRGKESPLSKWFWRAKPQGPGLKKEAA